MRPEQTRIAKQMIDFNRVAFGSGYNAMLFMQEQTEKLFSSFLEKAPWIPEEGKKAMADWGDACKKGRDELKKAVDESFDRVESYFVQSDKSKTPELHRGSRLPKASLEPLHVSGSFVQIRFRSPGCAVLDGRAARGALPCDRQTFAG